MKKVKFKNILKLIKIIILITMIILSYTVTDRVVDFVLLVEVATIKRVFNIVLVLMLVVLYMWNYNKENEV